MIWLLWSPLLLIALTLTLEAWHTFWIEEDASLQIASPVLPFAELLSLWRRAQQALWLLPTGGIFLWPLGWGAWASRLLQNPASPPSSLPTTALSSLPTTASSLPATASSLPATASSIASFPTSLATLPTTLPLSNAQFPPSLWSLLFWLVGLWLLVTAFWSLWFLRKRWQGAFALLAASALCFVLSGAWPAWGGRATSLLWTAFGTSGASIVFGGLLLARFSQKTRLRRSFQQSAALSLLALLLGLWGTHSNNLPQIRIFSWLAIHALWLLLGFATLRSFRKLLQTPLLLRIFRFPALLAATALPWACLSASLAWDLLRRAHINAHTERYDLFPMLLWLAAQAAAYTALTLLRQQTDIDEIPSFAYTLQIAFLFSASVLLFGLPFAVFLLRP